MGRIKSVPYEQKLVAVQEYLSGQISILKIASEYNLNKSSVKRWVRKYKTFGAKGLMETHTNTIYSEELKMNAILDYINGQGSLEEISKKYKIHSSAQLRQWVIKYNSHEKIKSSGAGGSSIMTKGRNTTFEERIEIVKHCIEHDRNYNETATKYKVSYQQVRSWTVKYEKIGVDALIDRRGKRKFENQLTDVERLKAENKLLEAKNKRLGMENELLKKLEGIERSWS